VNEKITLDLQDTRVELYIAYRAEVSEEDIDPVIEQIRKKEITPPVVVARIWDNDTNRRYALIPKDWHQLNKSENTRPTDHHIALAHHIERVPLRCVVLPAADVNWSIIYDGRHELIQDICILNADGQRRYLKDFAKYNSRKDRLMMS
jgi:hypothetical protein